MKNWIVLLLLIVVPLVSYLILKDNHANLTTQTALASNLPTVIKFESPLCIDCKKLETVLNELIPQYQDKINFVKIEATKSDKATTEKVEKYKVTVVPTLIFLDAQGKEVRKTEGFIEKNILDKCLKELLKNG